MPREEIKPSKKESHSPKNNNTNTNSVSDQTSTINLPLNSIDQQTVNLLNVINGSGNSGTAVIQNPPTGQTISSGNNNNVQYYFAMPANGIQNGTNGIQLQGLQNIQGIQNIQTIQGLQGLQGLQGAQIIVNSNGQPTLYMGNRDC